MEQPNSRGVANLVMRCKFCKSEGTVDIVPKSIQKYDGEQTSQFQPLVIVEGRGWEPSKWIPTGGFSCRGIESNTRFDDIDLSEDWCDYDEAASESVEIMNVEHKVSKSK